MVASGNDSSNDRHRAIPIEHDLFVRPGHRQVVLVDESHLAFSVARVVLDPGVVRSTVTLNDKSLAHQHVDSTQSASCLWCEMDAERCESHPDERLRARLTSRSARAMARPYRRGRSRVASLNSSRVTSSLLRAESAIAMARSSFWHSSAWRTMSTGVQMICRLAPGLFRQCTQTLDSMSADRSRNRVRSDRKRDALRTTDTCSRPSSTVQSPRCCAADGPVSAPPTLTARTMGDGASGTAYQARRIRRSSPECRARPSSCAVTPRSRISVR